MVFVVLRKFARFSVNFIKLRKLVSQLCRGVAFQITGDGCTRSPGSPDVADPEEIVGWCLPNVDVLAKKIVHGYPSVYPGDR